jgi:hypothetical protein
MRTNIAVVPLVTTTSRLSNSLDFIAVGGLGAKTAIETAATMQSASRRKLQMKTVLSAMGCPSADTPVHALIRRELGEF